MSKSILKLISYKREAGLKINRSILLRSNSYFSNAEEEYDTVAQYPKIKDRSIAAKIKDKCEEWPNKFRRHATVEEKLLELNMPKYWGWPSVMIKDSELPFDSLPHIKHITKTHLIAEEKLPQYWNIEEERQKNIINDVKDELVDCIGFELRDRRSVDEDKRSKCIIYQINRILTKHLSKENHIFNAQVDYDPRIEAFWSVGSLNSTEEIERLKKFRKSDTIRFSYWMQYNGKPVLQIRTQTPLEPVVPFDEATKEEFSIEKYEFGPTVLGFQQEIQHGTCIPGFWPGDPAEFSLLSYHLSNHVKNHPKSYGEADTIETLQSQAILSNYGWVYPIACYQGFTTFTDVTYPFVNQAIITDGQQFMFSLYQLNTTLFYDDYLDNCERVNLCWTTPYTKLFDSVEDGKLVGFNEEVLKNLVLFYTKQPQDASALPNLKPYLGDKEQKIADFEDKEKRNWLEKCFKHIVSKRPRNKLKYEVYDWEIIYKLRFQTRPLEAKRRPYEHRENPFTRRLDDHVPAYIPRALRPDKDLPKYKQRKFEKTYWPK